MDIEKANHAWRELIGHHAMMRTIFTTDGQFQQSLNTVPKYQFSILDYRNLTNELARQQVDQLRGKMLHQKFQVDTWPLFEVKITLLADDISRIHMCFDNIIFDAFSILFLLRQWSQLYHDPEFELPQLTVSFRDYVMALERIEKTDAYRRDVEYWNNRLDSIDPAPELPLYQQPELLAERRFSHLEKRLSRTQWSALKGSIKTMGLTESAVLLTAYAEILAKWSRRSTFTINLTRFNKMDLHPQMDEVIGDFTALTLFSYDGSKGDCFFERCKYTLEQLWKDLAHPHVCGGQVLRELSKKNGDQYKHGMPVVFTSSLGLDSAPDTVQPWIGKRTYSISQTSQVWMDHQILEDDGELVLIWDVADALFPAGMPKDMFQAYTNLVIALAGQPQLWTQESKSLVEDPHMEVKQRVNETDRDIINETLLSLFEKQYLTHPEHLAVADAEIRLTYRELMQAAEQISQSILQHNIASGRIIAIVMEKGWEQAAAVLGIFKSGAAYLPIDPSTPVNRMAMILEESNADIIITQPEIKKQCEWPDHIFEIVVEQSVFEGDMTPHVALSETVKPDDLAYIIYTSGSTGRPKGVMIQHFAAVNTILDINRRFQVTSEDKVLSLSSLCFDLSVYDLFGMLAAGACIVFPQPDKMRETKHWLKLLKDEQITIWNTVPASMKLLTNSLNEKDIPLIGNPLRLVLLSGDWIPLHLPDDIKSVFPNASVVALGGATEASIWSNYFVVEDVAEEWKSIPYGTPLANQKYFILNELLEDSPVWVPGDLYIGGIGLAQGYYHDEEKTAQRFITHPRTGERIYATGDIARYWPDGVIEFLGREDSQVKINGYRIEMGEIEEVVRSFDGVEDVIVEPYNMELNTKLACFIVPGSNCLKNEEQLPKITNDRSIPETEANHLLEQKAWMDSASTQYVYRMFSELNLFNEQEKVYTIDDIKKVADVTQQYDNLLGYWCGLLVEDGVLHQLTDNSYICIEKIDGVISSLQGETDKSPCKNGHLLRILDKMPMRELVSGQFDPLRFFTMGEDSVTPKALEQFSDSSSPCIEAALDMLQTLVQQGGSNEKLNIWEVGTRVSPFCLSCRELLSKNVNYIYTDESWFFIEQEQQALGEDDIQFKLLDFNRSPLEQGFDGCLADIIIANNTIHRFKHIDKTLGYIKQLLKPSGVFILLEATVNSRSVMNTMSFLTGGFSYLDDERVNTGLPMLSAEQWQEKLKMTGFAEIQEYPNSIEEKQKMGFCVFISQANPMQPAISEGELRTYLGQRLPAYMIPSKYIVLDALPLSSNGKIDRKALMKYTQEQAASVKMQPSNGHERELLDIWCKLLRKNEIGVTDNFFELGGDSLLAIQCVDQMNKRLGYEISMKQFYEMLTIQNIAEAISQLDEGEL